MAGKKVSVILSTYNAGNRLPLTLGAYNYQSFNKEQFEVIVVDDRSTDDSLQLLNKIKTTYPLHIIRNDHNLGRAATRNKGLDAASGDIIIFSDSDMLPEKDFIVKHVNQHNNKKNVFICGQFWNRIYTETYPDMIKLDKRYHSFIHKPLQHKLVLLYERNKISSYSSKQPWARRYEKLIRSKQFISDTFMFPWVYFILMNVSVKKQHILEVGKFDERFTGWGGEDEEMGYRLWKHGLKVVVDQNINNYHQEHVRIESKQHEESYANVLYFLEKHPDINPLLFYIPSSLSYLTRSEAYREFLNLRVNGHISKENSNKLFQLFLTFIKKEQLNKNELQALLNLVKNHHCPSLRRCIYRLER